MKRPDLLLLALLFVAVSAGAQELRPRRSIRAGKSGGRAIPRQCHRPGQFPDAGVPGAACTPASARAVNYRNRGGSTTVDFRGTALMPAITGHAKVDGKAGRLAIYRRTQPHRTAGQFGGQYLTYVLWAVTPEGRAVNLGEVLPGENGKDRIDVTTDLQAFGLIVTAEPYFSVTYPSNEVVAENVILQDTKGFEESIDAKFDVLEGGQYIIDVKADQLPSARLRPGFRSTCSKPATR